MEEIISTLIKIEKDYGEEIFSDKSRMMAIVKDYLPDYKREQRLIEKGLEINIYEKLRNLSVKEINIYRHRMLKELCDEHGLNQNFAEQVLEIWISFVERKRNKTAYNGLAQKDRGKVIAAYSKNAENKPGHIMDGAAVYEVSKKEELSIGLNGAFRLNRPKDKTVLYEIRRASEDKDLFDSEREDIIDLCIDRAEKDDVVAQSILGDLYYRGSIVKKNFNEAVKWFEKAAAQGDPKSQNNLAYCYFYGNGVKKNVPLALQWFTKAARQGELSAIISMANCYYGGIGVERDVSKALPWYIRAAEQGSADAQYILGECYYKGEGFQRDRVEALKWYQKAAHQNHKEAQEKLLDLERYKKVLESKIHGNILERNTLLYIERFVTKLSNRLTADLVGKLSIYSHNNDMLPEVTNRITGLGIRLNESERPLLLFNDTPGSLLRLSDVIVLTSMGIYINRVMRRRRFFYYADISRLEVLEDDKRIVVNNAFFNCISLRTEEMYELLGIIKDIIREFK